MDAPVKRFGNWFKTSITVRMLVVGFILLVLLVPLGFVKELIRERGFRQQEVIEEINGKWGKEVILYGPIFKIPYRTYKEEKVFNNETQTYLTKQEEVLHTAYFLPEQLDIQAEVDTELLSYGIYETVVYSTQLNLSGNFDGFDFSSREIPDRDILWSKATLLLRTSNLKGIRTEVEVALDSATYSLKPQFDNSSISTLESGFVKNLEEVKNQPIGFSLAMEMNGSERLRFVPIGKSTSTQMHSDWHSPSFGGEFLPDDDSKVIGPDGFEAAWSILEINRQFGQQFFDQLPDLSGFAYGTDLIVPIDDYQKTERSSKYGMMIIGLTLFVFLLIQLISKISIHPFQYLMIGLALVMFYTLLISITEHQDFLKAYLISGSAVIGLITLYSRGILRSFKFSLLIFLSMTALYSFIFVIIQLENYALLVGSVGLFIILAIIMFATRKIDWEPQE